MKLGFGRVVPAPPGDDATTEVRAALAAKPGLASGRVVGPEVVDASERAHAIVAGAEERAASILRTADAESAALRLRAETEARAEAAASVASRALLLAARENDALARQLDRVALLARVLAERLLGEELRLDPARIGALARSALAEARGARQVRVVAHPEDVPLIEAALAGLPGGAPATVVQDGERARGSLRLETEIGVLDADIAAQLDRLLPKLRESLGHD